MMYYMSCAIRKPVYGVSAHVHDVGHKPGCSATDGWRLEISDLGSRGTVLSI